MHRFLTLLTAKLEVMMDCLQLPVPKYVTFIVDLSHCYKMGLIQLNLGTAAFFHASFVSEFLTVQNVDHHYILENIIQKILSRTTSFLIIYLYIFSQLETEINFRGPPHNVTLSHVVHLKKQLF